MSETTTQVATRVQNISDKRVLSFVLDLGKRYKEFRSIFSEGIMTSKPKFTQKEQEEANEAWIRG